MRILANIYIDRLYCPVFKKDFVFLKCKIGAFRSRCEKLRVEHTCWSCQPVTLPALDEENCSRLNVSPILLEML